MSVRLGFSSWCFRQELASGEMSIDDVFDWIAESPGQHLELAGVAFPEGNLIDLADPIRAAAKRTGVELSGMCIGADFLTDDTPAQLATAKQHITLAAELGIKFFRHDVTPWGLRPTSIAEVEEAFPKLVEAATELAQFAAQHDIVTSIENHGFFMNGSERVQRLVHAVNRPNFGTTLDVGNFLCVDEDPVIATARNLPIATFIHIKDFYTSTTPREGWLETPGGRAIQGAMFGYGDVDTTTIVSDIVKSGYDGYLSLEYEGQEDARIACTLGINNALAKLSDVVG